MFEIETDTPYMLMVANIKKDLQIKMSQEDKKLWNWKLNIKRSSIPAVTHVDYSARIQTVHQTNPRYHKLLTKFKNDTDVLC